MSVMKTNLLFKRLLWIVGTILPVYLMLVFMPPGFGGVPWMFFVILVFLIEFIALVSFEQSCLWNGIVAFLFWIPMIGIDLTYPGTVNIDNGINETVFQILALALVHALIQMGIRAVLNAVLKK